MNVEWDRCKNKGYMCVARLAVHLHTWMEKMYDTEIEGHQNDAMQGIQSQINDVRNVSLP